MASQKEHLEGAKVDELRDFAGQKEIDLEGAKTKDEIVDKISRSKKASADEVKEQFPLEDTSTTAEGQGGNVPTDDLGAPDEEEDDVTYSDIEGPTRVTRSPEAVLDPALVDPGQLSERAEGRTSDPQNRVEGVTAAEVEPDINVGPKQSDAGPERYPFPPQGDVDVALVDPGDSDEEYDPPLNVDDWVILDDHELVPERLVGKMALVVNAPNEVAPDVHDHPNAARTPVPDAGITVRVRDETNATLVLPMEAFKTVGKGGRSAVLPVG